MPDPRTPVIIGVGQVSQTPARDDEFHGALDAVALMARAVEEAAADTGGTAVLDAIQSMAVVAGLWSYQDPAALVALELGLSGVATTLTAFGGQIPLQLVAVLADRIAAGECEVAVMTCGENNLTRRHLSRIGEKMPRRTEADHIEVERWGAPLEMGDATAIERGAEMPRNSYAIFDSALRLARGETLDEARDRSAALWAGYARIAMDNPHAADRSGMTAEEIRAPSDSNRFVSWPYTKAMCANNNVDQAGALIICSTEAADRLGVDPDQRVHPHHCISSADTASLIGRHDLSSAPGLEAAAALLRREVGDIDEIAHLDLYSCFPAVVSLTSDVLGLRPDRPLTVTGGLAFAGAPINFAAGQSLIGMVSALRSDPGSLGLVHGNGGHIAKHTFGTYSTVPPTRPHRSLTAANDAPTRVAADPDRSGPALLDGITVAYDHDGPSRAIGLVRFDDGSRTWATSTDSELMAECTEQECVGREIDVDAGSLKF